MDAPLETKSLIRSYDKLANRAIKLNESYLSLLNIYSKLSLSPDIHRKLKEKGQSPVKVVEAMSREQQSLKQEFTNLSKLIEKTQRLSPNNSETEDLESFANDCKTMLEFVSSIELNNLQKMFESVSK